MGPCLQEIAPLLVGAPFTDALVLTLDECKGDALVQSALIEAIAAGAAHPDVRAFRPLFVWWEDERLVTRLFEDAAEAPLGPSQATLRWWLDEVRPPGGGPFVSVGGVTWLVVPSCGCPGGPGGSAQLGNVLVLHPDAHASALRVEVFEADPESVAHMVCGCPGVGTVWVDDDVRRSEREEEKAWLAHQR